MDYGNIQHPVLIALRKEKVARNLKAASEKRSNLMQQRRAEAATVMQQRRLEEASAPLTVFLGGEVTGVAAAFFRLLPPPKLEEIPLDTDDPFEKADLAGLESHFVVNGIVLAPGAMMTLHLYNYAPNGPVHGRSMWSWHINLAYPSDTVSYYKGMSFGYLLEDGVKSVSFQDPKVVQYGSIKCLRYHYSEVFDFGSGTAYYPTEKTLVSMLSTDVVSFRISQGPEEAPRTHKGTFTPEARIAIYEILNQMKYRNPNNRVGG